MPRRTVAQTAVQLLPFVTEEHGPGCHGKTLLITTVYEISLAYITYRCVKMILFVPPRDVTRYEAIARYNIRSDLLARAAKYVGGR
jgi:hypothetical protein